ncbi:MAG TPA: DUF1648 domain-containing protein [Thermomicrobiales bacterium]|nr:DUF1648 domain-containing protein [Thermomicrobiales bacterium]
MQRWRPAPSAGSLVGILAFLLCAGGIAGLVLRSIPSAAGQPAAVALLWAVVGLLALGAALLVVLLWGYFTLGYALDERDGGALVVRWAWRRVRIPLAEIEYLGPARQLLRPARAGRLWPWPGYYLNALTDPSLGRIRLFATLPPRRQLLVCSARGSFGLSPDRPGQLLERYRALRADRPALLAPARTPLTPAARAGEGAGAVPAGAVPARLLFDDEPRGAEVALFRDRPAVSLILAAGLLVAAMLWFIVLRFGTVPSALPLHYSATGQPDRIGTPREIFVLPLITALVAVANVALAWSVMRFDRFAARLLLAGTCMVQLVAWVAVLTLL